MAAFGIVTSMLFASCALLVSVRAQTLPYLPELKTCGFGHGCITYPDNCMTHKTPEFNTCELALLFSTAQEYRQANGRYSMMMPSGSTGSRMMRDAMRIGVNFTVLLPVPQNRGGTGAAAAVSLRQMNSNSNDMALLECVYDPSSRQGQQAVSVARNNQLDRTAQVDVRQMGTGVEGSNFTAGVMYVRCDFQATDYLRVNGQQMVDFAESLQLRLSRGMASNGRPPSYTEQLASADGIQLPMGCGRSKTCYGYTTFKDTTGALQKFNCRPSMFPTDQAGRCQVTLEFQDMMMDPTFRRNPRAISFRITGFPGFHDSRPQANGYYMGFGISSNYHDMRNMSTFFCNSNSEAWMAYSNAQTMPTNEAPSVPQQVILGSQVQTQNDGRMTCTFDVMPEWRSQVGNTGFSFKEPINLLLAYGASTGAPMGVQYHGKYGRVHTSDFMMVMTRWPDGMMMGM